MDALTLDDLVESPSQHQQTPPNASRPASSPPAKPKSPDLTTEIDLTPFVDDEPAPAKTAGRSAIRPATVSGARPPAAPASKVPPPVTQPAMVVPAPPPPFATKSAPAAPPAAGLPNFGDQTLPVAEEGNASVWDTNGPSLTTGRQAGTVGQFFTESMRSLRFAGENMGSVFILSIIYGICIAAVLFGAYFILRYLISDLLGLSALRLTLYFVLTMLGGYALRFFLDVTQSGISNSPAPMLPTFDVGTFMLTGLRGMGLTIVYFMPIITIPLWPLGMLALAHTDDGRAYNLIWAVRAAARRPVALLAFWGILIIFFIMMFLLMIPLVIGLSLVGGYFAHTVKDEGSLFVWRILISVGFMILVSTLTMTMATAAGRSNGLLGHFFPDLLDTLPKRPNGLASLGFLSVGLVLTIVVYAGLISASLDSVDEYARDRVASGFTLKHDYQAQSYQPIVGDPPPQHWTLPTPGAVDNTAPGFPFATPTPGNNAQACSPVPTADQTKELEQASQASRKEMEAIRTQMQRYAAQHNGQYPLSMWHLQQWMRSQGVDIRALQWGRYQMVMAVDANWPAGSILLRDMISFRSTQFALTVDGQFVTHQSGEMEQLISDQRRTHMAPPTERPGPIVPGNMAGNMPDVPGNMAMNMPANNWAPVPGNLVHNASGNNADSKARPLTRKFPRKPVPESAGRRERAQLNLENLYADIRQYMEENDGRMPFSTKQLVDSGISKEEDLRSAGAPATNLNVEYVGSLDRLGILAYDSFEYDVSNKKVIYVLLTNGKVIPGASVWDIRRAINDGRVGGQRADDGAEVEIKWATSGWDDIDGSEHKLGEMCRVVKHRKDGREDSYAGYDLAGEAKDLKDKAFTDYRDKIHADFKDLVPSEVKEVSYKLGEKTYTRLIGTDKTKTKIATVIIGVEGGHCVSYWFVGSPGQYVNFQHIVGKASAKDATTQPTTKPRDRD